MHPELQCPILLFVTLGARTDTETTAPCHDGGPELWVPNKEQNAADGGILCFMLSAPVLSRRNVGGMDASRVPVGHVQSLCSAAPSRPSVACHAVIFSLEVRAVGCSYHMRRPGLAKEYKYSSPSPSAAYCLFGQVT